MKKRLTAVLLSVVMLFGVAACGDDSSVTVSGLKELSPVVYTHDSGMEFSLPEAWQESDKDEYTVSFLDADNKISMVARLEIGGMSYFSNAELGGLAADIGMAVLADGAVVESGEYGRLSAAGYACVNGKNADGINAVCETVILQHIPAVRCYVSICTDPDTFTEYEDVFDDIYASLKIIKSEDELYEKLDDMQDAYEQEMSKRETEKTSTEE